MDAHGTPFPLRSLSSNLPKHIPTRIIQAMSKGDPCGAGLLAGPKWSKCVQPYKDPWALHSRGWTLYNRGLYPENPWFLRVRILRALGKYSQIESSPHSSHRSGAPTKPAKPRYALVDTHFGHSHAKAASHIRNHHRAGLTICL